MVVIFPNEAGVIRLASSVLLEVHDESAVAERRYLSEALMAKLYRNDNDRVKRKEVVKKTNEVLAS